MGEIKEVLMRRDGLTSEQADREIKKAQDRLYHYLENDDLDGAENICEEMFGLEPDYVDELIDLRRKS